MRRTLRKIIISVLAVVIAISAPITALAAPNGKAEASSPEVIAPVFEEAVPISAPGGGSDESGFETALIAAKTLLKIDDSIFTDFNYSSRYSNYETMEGLIWSFNWSGSKDAKYAYVYANVTDDGILLDYNKYSSGGRDFGLAEVSKSEALAIADEFVKNANPDTYTYYKALADVYVSINSSEYTIVYNAQSNGYRFTAAMLYVRVNKFTGEVTSYNSANYNPGKFDYEDAASIISEEEAAAAYAEKIGLNLEYVSSMNYETGELSVFPVYRFNSYYDTFISAVTGEVVSYVYDRGANGSAASGNSGAAPMAEAAQDSSAGGSSRVNLSPAEISAIEKVSNFITSEQALQKLIEAADLEDIDMSIFAEQYISLNRDYVDRDRYCYNINMFSYGVPDARGGMFYGLYGRVEAESGRVLSFDISYDNGFQGAEAAAEYTDEQVSELIEAFILKEAPGEYAKSKLDRTYLPGAEPYNYRGYYYYYQYVRYENDVPFSSNGINVSFDPVYGRITSYSLNWYNNISFPDVSGVLPAGEALSLYVKDAGSSIYYTTVGGGKAALVYQFGNGDYVDPFTGGALDYSGAPKADTSVQPEYDDIAGHWCESVVTRLLDNGIAMWSGSFDPDRTMTQIEFLKFLMLLEPYYYYGYSTEMFFAERNIDIKVDDERILTKQDAASIIARYLGYGKLAEQPEWFVYPFSDSVSDEFRGYITICYMLGIIKGDGSGGFGAEDNITRAQAAVMLYNLILIK